MNPFLIGGIVLAVWAYLKNNGGNSFPILNFGKPATGVTTSFQPPTTTGSTTVNSSSAPQIQPNPSGSGVPTFSPQARGSWNPSTPSYGRFYNPGQLNRQMAVPPPSPAPATCGCGCSPSTSCGTCKSTGRGNCMSASPSNSPVVSGGNVASSSAQAFTINHLQRFGDANQFQVYLQQSMDQDAFEGGVPAGQIRSNYQPQ
jgi:hypothetical protein